MKPLDFSKHAPRGPREQLDGLAMLPRTIDKFRASLPGGNLNGYRIDGISSRLLGWLGVNEDEMRQAVAAASNDEGVAAWLRERTDASQYAEFTDRMTKRTVDDVADKDRFRTLYPWAEQTELRTIFDIIEEDDRRTFSGR
jgi:uncharacterized protein DUF5069